MALLEKRHREEIDAIRTGCALETKVERVFPAIWGIQTWNATVEGAGKREDRVASVIWELSSNSGTNIRKHRSTMAGYSEETRKRSQISSSRSQSLKTSSMRISHSCILPLPLDRNLKREAKGAPPRNLHRPRMETSFRASSTKLFASSSAEFLPRSVMQG